MDFRGDGRAGVWPTNFNSPVNFSGSSPNPSFSSPTNLSSISELFLIQASNSVRTTFQDESFLAIPESPKYTGQFGNEFLLLKGFLSWPNTLNQKDWAGFEAATLALTAALFPKNP